MTDRAIALYVNPGARLSERLKSRTREKDKWKPGAWSILVSALNDEAQFMREGQVEAACSYSLIVLLCVRYLKENNDIRRANELRLLIRRDTSALSEYLFSKENGELAASEEEAFGMSIEGLKEAIEGLSQTYPGAL